MADEIVEVVAYKGIRIVIQKEGEAFSYMTGNGFFATGFALAEKAMEDAKRVIDRQ